MLTLVKMILSELLKIARESLSGDNGKYSSKKLSMFQYAQLGCGMILSDMIANKGILNYNAFLIVIGFAFGVSYLGLKDKQSEVLNINEVELKDKELNITNSEVNQNLEKVVQ